VHFTFSREKNNITIPETLLNTSPRGTYKTFMTFSI